MTILDTNSILRYIVQDDEEKANVVERVMRTEEYLIPIEVLAEAVYVLHKSYKIARRDVATELTVTINDENAVVPHKEAVEIALYLYGATNRLDFVDCILYGYAKAEGHKILTFDNALNEKLNQPNEPEVERQ